MHEQRAKFARFIHRKAFSNVVIALILINSITLGLETDAAFMAAHGGFLHLIDHLILGFFVAELTLKLCVFRGVFFRSGWNIFDFVIITISLIPSIGSFSVLRTLRIFRTLRLISTVPAMRTVVSALLKSIPGMASVLSILIIVFYVSAVMATQTFGVVSDPKMYALFGTIKNSMFTLFQLMAMDNFTDDIIGPTLVYFPHATAFFVLFIVVTTFSVLNLFIGIIVDALNGIHEQENEGKKEVAHDELMCELKKIRSDIDLLLKPKHD